MPDKPRRDEPRHGGRPAFDDLVAIMARLRTEYGRACVARGRRLGSYIEARSRPQRRWTPEQLDQRPERVLSEVALALDEIPELALEI